MVSMTRASTGSEARRCSTAWLGSKPNAPSPSKSGATLLNRSALDRQHATFGCDAAPRGKAADLTAGGEHPVARLDDRERVPAERLSHGARRPRRPQPRDDVAVLDT